jgi:hypothetical protein
LFGAAVDPALGDGLTVTLISSLPEDKLHATAGGGLGEREVVVEKRERVEGIVAVPVVKEKDGSVTEIMEPSEGFGPDEPSASGVDPEKTALELVEVPVAEAPVAETPADPVADPMEVPAALGEAAVAPPAGDERVAEEREEVVKLPVAGVRDAAVGEPEIDAAAAGEPLPEALSELPSLKRKLRGNPQGELALDGGPKGKFEGESPNVFEGEDLDIPPFLRQRR